MERNERISAVLDGELDDATWKRLTQEWTEDDDQTMALYGAVGDALRASSLTAFHNPRVLAKIQVALQAEPTVLAPTLRASWRTQLAAPIRVVERAALCGLAVLALTLGLHQAVPVQMSDIQIVKTSPGIKISEEELMAWNDLLIAHQLQSPRGPVLAGGLGRIPNDTLGPQDIPLRVNASNQAPEEWMNVWEQEPNDQEAIRFDYVSSIH